MQKSEDHLDVPEPSPPRDPVDYREGLMRQVFIAYCRAQLQPIFREDGHRLTVITMLSTQPLGLQEEEAMSWTHLLKVSDGVLKGQVSPAKIHSERATDTILVPRVNNNIF